jgi:DNA-binding NarL/FixJ family response regulator
LKILVVGDHRLIREALRGVLKEVKGDATVLEASTGGQAMQVFAEHPDLELILLDLNLPDRDGFSVLTELGERYPAISVVVLSAQQDRGSVARALHLGAVGFIPILKALKEPPQEPPEPAPAPREPPPNGPKNLSGGAAAEQPVISTPET